ncbi:chemotaxis-specific protein-glutamate methyltransferase CheB [candidate division CSSED10-310 bacterium]|uniref:Protein-glutamate methylesterase/protein-glutamine glutaminase n=1 Tax=candidate division CSSED10-310 bacterium TaxID=2855610 RepID=A0ABV6YTJ8_UNCC1
MIKTLIVDDSSVVRLYIRAILKQDPEIIIVGEARDGQEALEKTKQLKPDVITMDIRMPRMDGLEATRAIMEQCPTPIIVVSSSINDRELNVAYNALQAGALAILEKPAGVQHPDFEHIKDDLINHIKLMSQVSLVRRRAIKKPPGLQKKARVAPGPEYKVVGIAASTGGPQAIRFILDKLPQDFPVPILVVQHMTRGFMQGMVKWLNSITKLDIVFAQHEERVVPGKVYFCEDDFHLSLGRNMKIALLPDPPLNGFRPSANILFQSLAQGLGQFAIGVILTGMGDDGSQGIKMMKDKGATTIAQDQESSIVFGMPRAAIEQGAADKIVSLNELPATLEALVGL